MSSGSISFILAATPVLVPAMLDAPLGPNPLSANSTKWPNTLKQFGGNFLWKGTLCGNCAFPQNFRTRKLGEISVFYAVRL